MDGALKAGDRAQELVRQILAFSRQDDRRPRQVDLQVIITEALQLARAMVPATIEIHRDLDTACGIVVVDPTHMNQIIVNLAANAVDALKGKTGLLEVKLYRVVVEEHSTACAPELDPGSYARLTVHDNGYGMDDQTMAHIFDPFFTTKEIGEGTGMGLSVVHDIVAGYGGAVVVSSEVGHGASFEIYLPLAEVEGEDEA